MCKLKKNILLKALRTCMSLLFVYKWATTGIFCLFSSFQQLTVNISIAKFCWWLDSNCGPLVLKATALPTKAQPLLYGFISFMPWVQLWKRVCNSAHFYGTKFVKVHYLSNQTFTFLQDDVVRPHGSFFTFICSKLFIVKTENNR